MELPTKGETQFCEVLNGTIQNKAKEFSVPGDLVATARNIFYFVRDNIAYEDYANTRKGAYKTLMEKRGNCCDQAHLLVALLRAAEIPTYYAHGTNHWWTVPCIDKQYHCDPTNRKHEFGAPQHDAKNKNFTLYNSLNH
jgi:hypothetical protein